MRELPTVSVDFETWYSKEYSIRTMSPWAYVFDERFDAYLVAIHGPGIHWVGNPRDFDWRSIHGYRWCMHNAGFDGLIVTRLQRDGVIPADVKPGEIFDTADMVAFLRCKRALKDAARILLGREISKGMRDKMEGVTWADAIARGWKEAMIKYGGEDAEPTYLLFEKYAHLWPEAEQTISRLTREAGWQGMHLDKKLVTDGLKLLGDKVLDTKRVIPWATEDDSGEKPLSVGAIRKQARKDGITEVPASFAMTSEEANDWEDMWAEKFPWVSAIREYRRTNMLYAKVKTLDKGLREDGTFPYSVKYMGAAATGRSSAGSSDGNSNVGGKFNILNMPRKSMFGVDVRPMFIAPPGRKLLIIDYGQIEARLLLWRVGDDKTLGKIRAGMHLYEAGAEELLGLPNAKGLKESDPASYQMVKGTYLGCGYSMGGAKFSKQAPLLTSGAYRPTEEEAFRVVYLWREKNPRVVRHWAIHQQNLLRTAASHESYKVELGSGRWLEYFQPRAALYTDPKTKEQRRQVLGYQTQGGDLVNLYGGKITENEIQATSRDMLCDGQIAIDKLGLHVYFTLYDEFVIDVPADGAIEARDAVVDALRHSSPWAKECPLGFDVKITDHYEK